ncbi:hypothetical protein AALB39_18120 [Lachnospiraceae bacterium 54-53]
MTEADILAMTYGDTCTVYRPYKEDLPGGETVFKKGLEGKVMYPGIPCALSSPSGGKLYRKKPVFEADMDYLLFVRPEVDIQKTDTVEVLQEGHRILVEAGRGGYYSSHNQYPVKLAKGQT